MSFIASAVGISAGAASAIGAGASAVGSIASGAMKKRGARRAADRQESAAQQANQMQWDMYQQQRGDSAAYRDAGGRAITGMEDQDFQRDFSAADFKTDPGYAFRMAEGQKALDRGAAARGGMFSGRAGKEMNRYTQGVASQEYGKAYDRFNADRDRRFGRLSSIAGMGQNAINQTGQAAQHYANQYGSNLSGAAGVSGAADIAGANAVGNAFSGVGQSAMDYGAAKRQEKWIDKWKAGRPSGGNSRGPMMGP